MAFASYAIECSATAGGRCGLALSVHVKLEDTWTCTSWGSGESWSLPKFGPQVVDKMNAVTKASASHDGACIDME